MTALLFYISLDNLSAFSDNLTKEESMNLNTHYQEYTKDLEQKETKLNQARSLCSRISFWRGLSFLTAAVLFFCAYENNLILCYFLNIYSFSQLTFIQLSSTTLRHTWHYCVLLFAIKIFYKKKKKKKGMEQMIQKKKSIS